MAAAARAAQLQKMREAEQQSRRRALNLPAPQVSDAELEEIVKMGMAGDRASRAAVQDGDAGLVSSYSNIVGATPIRTPRAPAQEDHIANEIRNIRALTETQSSLLGGENTPLHEGSASTGFDGVAPRKQNIVTPNPMATPLQPVGPNGAAAVTGATPLRTPRDNFAINEAGQREVLQTPRDIRLAENAARQSLRAKLSALPKPKETEWELEELPSESAETNGAARRTEEDQEDIDRRERLAKEAAAAAEFRRQTQVYQRSLPRPQHIDYKLMQRQVDSIQDPIQATVAQEAALLIANDARMHPTEAVQLTGRPPALERLDDDLLERARAELARETHKEELQRYITDFESVRDLPPEAFIDSMPQDEALTRFFVVEKEVLDQAEQGNKLEKKLALLLGGYQSRAKTLRGKIVETAEAVQTAKIALDSFRTLQIGEEAALSRRLERLREEVSFMSRREREAQEGYRQVRAELQELGQQPGERTVNGYR